MHTTKTSSAQYSFVHFILLQTREVVTDHLHPVHHLCWISSRRERGDPKEMLRAINPREAQLADAASGIHVRFRLGGTMFPPLVFYKIFTHR